MLFILLFFISLFSAVASEIWSRQSGVYHWYLALEGDLVFTYSLIEGVIAVTITTRVHPYRDSQPVKLPVTCARSWLNYGSSSVSYSTVLPYIIFTQRKKTGCWFVGGDDLTGALRDL